MTDLPQSDETEVSNTDRLKAHLEADSLAAAFLEAWIKPGTPQERQARLLDALDEYLAMENAANGPASAE